MPASAAGGLTAVRFMLDTNFLPKHGIFFAAQGFNFYKQEGLDVTFQPSTGSYATSIAVGAGKMDFGFADFDTMVKARVAAGAEVKQIATIHAKSPFAVITLPRDRIRTFRDLAGKKIAGEAAGSVTILFPLVLQLCHMSTKDVEFITVDSTAKLPGLLAGKWQAFLAYSVSDPATMIGEGITPVVIPWTECGFSGYSNGLVAADKTIKGSPDLTQRFVRATLRGVQFACTHRDEAAKNTLKFVPAMKLRAAQAGIQLACGIVWTPEAEQHGLGYMAPSGVEHTVGLAKTFLELKGDVDLGSLYTNAFVERAHVLKGTVLTAPR